MKTFEEVRKNFMKILLELQSLNNFSEVLNESRVKHLRNLK